MLLEIYLLIIMNKLDEKKRLFIALVIKHRRNVNVKIPSKLVKYLIHSGIAVAKFIHLYL